jgi:deazaflavin-dependent oxidoreductase (nitroreductase family)
VVDSRAARLAIRVHRAVLRLSGGRLGSRLGHLEQVLLTTTGRRTGRPRTTPLAVTPVDGDRLVLVASDGGADRHPAWYLNLAAHPDVIVRRGTVERRYRARTTSGAERERLWHAAVANHAGYASYQRRTDRQIPVVLLEPLE